MRTSARSAPRPPAAGWTEPGGGAPRDAGPAELKQLPGIGDFSAELVLVRGAATPTTARHEPRLGRGAALDLRLDEPPDHAGSERAQVLASLPELVVLMLRVLLETETG